MMDTQERDKNEPWLQTASTMLVLYSILAATCGVFILIIIQEHDTFLSCNWLFPLSVLGLSFFIFLYSAEAVSEAVDQQDVKKYVSTHCLYNIGVILLLSGFCLVVFYHYHNYFEMLLPNVLWRSLAFIVFVISISTHWLRDLLLLVFWSKKKFNDYILELKGKIPSKPDKAKVSWSAFFFFVRQILHRK